MEELTELKSSETIPVPPDEVIKLQLLQMAIDSRSVDPLGFAKEMYEWVKEVDLRESIVGESWKEYGNKYTTDLTGSSGNSKTVVAEEPKE